MCKIDHSTIDPGYYEYKMNDIKSNKDLMMKRLSNADAFAKSFVTDLKTKTGTPSTTEELREPRLKRFETKADKEAGDLTDIHPSHETIAPPPPPPEQYDEKTKRNKRMLTGRGLNISPI